MVNLITILSTSFFTYLLIGGLGVGDGRSKSTVNALYETDLILHRERFSVCY